MEPNLDKSITILVVEDNKSIRKVLTTLMGKLGFSNVEEAFDGQNAWDILNRGLEVGLILTDLNMPDMSGLELAKKIRSNPKYNNVPIIAITANTLKETIVAAGKAGMDGFVAKPFEVNQITKKIGDAFQRRASANEAKQ